MSDQHTNETRELDLDANVERASLADFNRMLDDLERDPEVIPALEAALRRVQGRAGGYVAEQEHTKGNGEDCPICESRNLPYPFMCVESDRAKEDAARWAAASVHGDGWVGQMQQVSDPYGLREQEEKLGRTYAQILENPDRHHPITVEWAKRHFGKPS